MEIRGTTQRIRAWIRPAAAKPASFAKNFDQTREFFHDRKTVIGRMALYSLSFFSVSQIVNPMKHTDSQRPLALRADILYFF